MQARDDTLLAAIGTAVLHVAALALMWLSGWFPALRDLRAPGPVVETTVEFTAEDVRAAEAAAAAYEPPPPPVREQQLTPQAPPEKPDTEDQEAVVEVGEEPSDEPEVQDERIETRQIDLTEDIERQREAEVRERQRLLEEVRKAREEAEKQTRMEEQRLRQLADRLPATPKPGPETRPQPPAGNQGSDAGLRARYIAALNATARDNWNTGLAPELVRCRVRFQQIPGGDVINVEFMDCPYDAQGRESVERALRKTPMPYSGFESVFESKVIVTFCHPEEACQ